MKNKKITNIKPCPLCGKKPTISVNSDGFDEVRCLKCGIFNEGYSRESAIKNWNETDYGDLI